MHAWYFSQAKRELIGNGNYVSKDCRLKYYHLYVQTFFKPQSPTTLTKNSTLGMYL